MFKAVLMDLDGTVYCGGTPVSGARQFVEKLVSHGMKYMYVTNRANWTPHVIHEHLFKMGIPSDPALIVTSSIATASFLEPSSAYVIGEEGLLCALNEKGFTISDESPRYVIVSLDTTLTYAKLEKAALLIREGAEFVATNTDPFVHSEKGISPGAGSIVSAIKTATLREPTVVGKPHPPIIKIALSFLKIAPKDVLIIGDNPETDILAGNQMGMKSALILNGNVQRRAIPPHIQPDWTVSSFTELEALVL